MLKKLKQFFFGVSPEDSTKSTKQSLQLAAAALLIELSRADFQQKPEEQAAIETALHNKFNLDKRAVTELLTLAEQESREAAGLYPFTSLINQYYSTPQKHRLLRALWQVAAADGDISKYEDALIRKIADLLYLPHSQFIRAKIEVLEMGCE